MKIRLVVLYSLILRPEDSIDFYQLTCRHFPDEAACKTTEFEGSLRSEFGQVNNNQEDNIKTERTTLSTNITFNNSSMSTHFFFF